MAGPLFFFGLALAGCMTAGALYILLFGSRGREFGPPTPGQKGQNRHVSWQAKPVFLKQTADVDPWTIAVTGSDIRPLGLRQTELETGPQGTPQGTPRDERRMGTPQGTPRDERRMGTPQFAVEPEDPFVAPGSLPSALKRKIRHTNPFARPGQKTELKQVVPFELMDGEGVLVQAVFSIPLVCSGYLFLTDRRVMATYLRTQFLLWPPRLKRTPKRHQIRLKNIKKVGIFEARRAGYLVAAAALCWWIPWGLLAAAVGVSAYFFLPRRELSISARDGMYRTYPVRQSELSTLLVTFGRLLREDK